MDTQPKALWLSRELDAYPTAPHHKQAAAELRRLHAENELLATASDKLRVAWRDEVHNLMKDKDQLQAQRDALLEALRALVQNEGLEPYSYLDKGIGTATAAGQRWLNARAVIAAANRCSHSCPTGFAPSLKSAAPQIFVPYRSNFLIEAL